MKILKNNKLWETAETVFQVLFLIYTILGFNSITNGNSIISIVMRFAYVLGGILLLVRLWNWKKYIKMPGLICLIVMCAVCAVSIVVNRQYDLKNNLVYLIFWVFYFFMYFTQSSDMSPELAKKRFHIAGHIVSVSSFILALLSLIMMATGYAEVVEINGAEITRGFIHGRLWGAYLTPNGGAVMASIAIFLSVYFIGKYRKTVYTVFAVVNILVQFFYIVFSDSRSGYLCLTFGASVYVLFASVFSPKTGTGKKKGILVTALVLITAVCALYVPQLTQQAYNEAVVSYSQRRIEKNAQAEADTQPEESVQTETATEPADEQVVVYVPTVERGYDLSGDISNRRFDIWKSGFEIFLSRPWYGTTFSGFLPYAMENLPQTYIVANDYMQMTTLDNDFVNLLVSNGIFAFAAFIIFVVWILGYLLPRAFKKSGRDPMIPVMMAVCMAAATFSMFTSGVLYMHAPFSILFWLSLGSMVTIVSHEEKGN